MNTQPSGDVTVAITSNIPSAATVSPETLTFTRNDWDTARPVTVTGVLDSDRNDEFVRLSNEASDKDYDSVSVTVDVTDNDSPGVSVSKNALTVVEENTTRGTAIRLRSTPSRRRT